MAKLVSERWSPNLRTKLTAKSDFLAVTIFEIPFSFFAGMQTLNGSDTTTLRSTLLSGAGSRVFAEEERSADSEVGHTNETIGFFAINSGVIMGSAVSFQDLLVGDVNRDGVVDFLDISPFISILSTSSHQDEADVNQDGDVSFLDISPFIALLSGS